MLRIADMGLGICASVSEVRGMGETIQNIIWLSK